TGKDQTVITSKGRHHDHQRYDDGPDRSKNHLRHGHRHPVVLSKRNLLDRQYSDVHQIGKNIQTAYHRRSKKEAETDVALRIAHLSANEGRTVPRVAAKNCTYHSSGNCAQRGHHCVRLRTLPQGMQRLLTRPVHAPNIAAHENKAEKGKPQQAEDLRYSKCRLNYFSFANTARINIG